FWKARASPAAYPGGVGGSVGPLQGDTDCGPGPGDQADQGQPQPGQARVVAADGHFDRRAATGRGHGPVLEAFDVMDPDAVTRLNRTHAKVSFGFRGNRIGLTPGGARRPGLTRRRLVRSCAST